MPPNSCLLHGRLGMKPSTLAFDITLACSGYIYGLQLAASLIDSGASTRVLLATADTYSRYIHEGDRATRCLFGDGGAVSVLAESDGNRGIRDIRCGTSGRHYDKFMIKAGGMRQPRSAETARESVDRSGNVRTPEHIQMDGLGVLSFFNATVPCAVRELLAQQQLTMDAVDLFVFHQASQVALDSLAGALQHPSRQDGVRPGRDWKFRVGVDSRGPQPGHRQRARPARASASCSADSASACPGVRRCWSSDRHERDWIHPRAARGTGAGSGAVLARARRVRRRSRGRSSPGSSTSSRRRGPDRERSFCCGATTRRARYRSCSRSSS